MIEKLYGNYKFQNALDVGGLLSNENKMFCFFEFVFSELKENHKILKNENVSMLPCVYYENNYDKYIVLEYNFLVQSMGRFIDQHSLGDAEMFLTLFSATPYEKKSNGITNNVLFTHGIFEKFWKCAYLNTSKTRSSHIKYSIPSIYQNDRTTIQFGAVMFPSTRLQKIIGEELTIDFLRASKLSNAEQVAFGSVNSKSSVPSCNKWWEKNKKEFTKKFFFSNNGLSLDAG